MDFEEVFQQSTPPGFVNTVTLSEIPEMGNDNEVLEYKKKKVYVCMFAHRSNLFFSFWMDKHGSEKNYKKCIAN